MTSLALEYHYETLAIGPASLPGRIDIPAAAQGLVVFAHGSGSSRESPRNLQVARQLQAAGFGTLLFDLLTEDEAAERERVFDIPLLTRRLMEAVHWTQIDTWFRPLPIGLFGASTGGAAALTAAACLTASVSAVVCRGARTDLAAEALAQVEAPTLLIVGAQDAAILEVNRAALERLACTKDLTVVPRATHLFEEPGALDAVAQGAISWFRRHLRPAMPQEDSRVP